MMSGEDRRSSVADENALGILASVIPDERFPGGGEVAVPVIGQEGDRENSTRIFQMSKPVTVFASVEELI